MTELLRIPQKNSSQDFAFFAIPSTLRKTHSASMRKITPEWLTEQLDKNYGSRSRLAEKLGITPDKVTRMAKGIRRPQTHEIPAILDFFGVRSEVDQELADIWSELTEEQHQTLITIAKALHAKQAASPEGTDGKE